MIKLVYPGWLKRRRYAALITALAIAAVAACGGGDATPQRGDAPVAPAAGVTQSPTRAPLPGPTRVPTPTPTPLEPKLSTPFEIDRSRLLLPRLFNFWTGADVGAIQELGERGVRSSFIPMVELTRFVFEDDTITQLGEALEKLTGEDFGGLNWGAWYRWLGQHPEIEPPPGYAT